ncbi:MAG: TonB-dependent receptor, partial [Georgfuchsia sp.]
GCMNEATTILTCTATLRGLTGAFASGLQVLIDGVSVYSPVFGGMFWAEIPLSLNDIERIEVVRGPNGASYGANSFQGVVNIITRDPVTENVAEFEANAGGLGIRDATLRIAKGQGDWRYRMTLGQRSDDGFASRPDSMRMNYMNLKMDYRVSLRDTIDLTLRGADKNKQLGEFNTTDPTFQPHHQTGDRLEFQTRWNHAESTDNEWWIQYYHQKFSQRDRLPMDLRALLAPLAGWPLPLPYEQEQDYATWRDGIELQESSRWSDRLRTVWGAEMRRDASRSGRLFATNEEQTEFLTRGFGNVEWIFADQWILHSGAMFERNSFASSGWSPRIALIHEVAPGHTLRASVSNARRTPSLYEEKSNYGFNFPIPVAPFNISYPIIEDSGKVDSERVHSEELGYVFSIPQAALSGDVRWFSDHYTGLISLRGQVKFEKGSDAVNLDDARTTGFDLTLQWEPQTDTHIRLAAAHTETTSTDQGSKYSISVPRDTLSLLLSQSFSAGWEASANYQRVSAMFWTDAGYKNGRMPAIDHLNIKLAKRIDFGEYQGEIAAVMQNVLGHYSDYYLGSTVGTPDTIARRIALLQIKIDH